MIPLCLLAILAGVLLAIIVFWPSRPASYAPSREEIDATDAVISEVRESGR